MKTESKHTRGHYTLAEIRNGTGFEKGVLFVQVKPNEAHNLNDFPCPDCNQMLALSSLTFSCENHHVNEYAASTWACEHVALILNKAPLLEECRKMLDSLSNIMLLMNGKNNRNDPISTELWDDCFKYAHNARQLLAKLEDT